MHSLLLLLFLWVPAAPSPPPPETTVLWVAPGGSDTGPGTEAAPFATVPAALRRARELRRLHDPVVAGGVTIRVKGGEYVLAEPLFIRPEDSGTPESPTIIEAAPGETPVFSGGEPVPGWRPGKGHLWIGQAPDGLRFRQLYVNGVKAIRARTPNRDEDMPRILGIDKKAGTIRVPADVLPPAAGDVEMVIHQMWATAVLRINTLSPDGVLTFKQPESRIEMEHPWPAAVIDSPKRVNGNSAFYLTNSLAFLDSPGEWFEDRGGKVYYWPRKGEDMRTARVIAPAQETLVRVLGAVDRPVSYVYVKGLRFAYTTWLRPSEEGHVPLQAGMFLLDAYKLKPPGTPEKKGLENQAWIGRPPAAVEVAYAHHVQFEGCRFGELASTGLDLQKGTHDDKTIGCVFRDIGGTGYQEGVYSDPAIETHLPYNPADARELCTKDTVMDNLVEDCGNEDWGCVGISEGYVRESYIAHNEVADVPYSGICVGWGWTKLPNAMEGNQVFANYVHHYATHMYDVGGIYTLSAQPGTHIWNNRVDDILHPAYVHDPEHWFYFYFDEGSSYITIEHNWCPGPRFMKNSNGPGNTWTDNGPEVADSIKLNAGLEPAYR